MRVVFLAHFECFLKIIVAHVPRKKVFLAHFFEKKIKYKNIPKNLVVRASGIKIDGQPPKFWKWTSTVHTKKPIGRECPAYKQDGECKDCRSCWSRSVKQVSYKEH